MQSAETLRLLRTAAFVRARLLPDEPPLIPSSFSGPRTQNIIFDPSMLLGGIYRWTAAVKFPTTAKRIIQLQRREAGLDRAILDIDLYAEIRGRIGERYGEFSCATADAVGVLGVTFDTFFTLDAQFSGVVTKLQGVLSRATGRTWRL